MPPPGNSSAWVAHPNDRSLPFWRHSAFGQAEDLFVWPAWTTEPASPRPTRAKTLSLVNGSRFQPPQRSRRRSPAMRAMRSSSAGQT